MVRKLDKEKSPIRSKKRNNTQSRNNRGLAASVMTSVTSPLPLFLIGALGVMMREDLQVGPTQFGTAISSFMLAAALLAIPGGRFGDRVGPRRSMRLSAGMVCAGMLGIGLIANSFSLLIICLIVAGLGHGLSNTSTSLAIAQLVPENHHGIAFGLKQASVPMASFTAGLAVPLIGLTIGWRWAFIGTPIAFLIIFSLTRGLESEQKPLEIKVEKENQRLSLLLIAIATGLGVAAITSMLGFYVQSAVDRGTSVGTAGVFFAIGSLVAVPARIFWGWLVDQYDYSPLRVLTALLVGGGIGFALLGLVESSTLLLIVTLTCFGVGWSWSGLVFLAATQESPNAPATASGVVSAGSGIGGLTGPLLFGAVVEKWSYTPAWIMASLWLILGSITVSLIPRIQKYSYSDNYRNRNLV